MNILGISAGFHDAGATVISPQGEILFAGHSERYSKKKNDADLHTHLLRDAYFCGQIGHIAYYERPWAKQLRQLYASQGVEWHKITTRQVLKQQLGFVPRSYSTHNHHLSHAAAGFQTSPYDRATVVVIECHW